MRRRSGEQHHGCCCDRIGWSGGWLAVIGCGVFGGLWFVAGGCEALWLASELVEVRWLAEAMTGLLWLAGDVYVVQNGAVTRTTFPSMQSGSREPRPALLCRWDSWFKSISDLYIDTSDCTQTSTVCDIKQIHLMLRLIWVFLQRSTLLDTNKII